MECQDLGSDDDAEDNLQDERPQQDKRPSQYITKPLNHEMSSRTRRRRVDCEWSILGRTLYTYLKNVLDINTGLSRNIFDRYI